MRAWRALGWTLLLCLEASFGETKEPKDFIAENLHKARDVVEAGFRGCLLQMKISYSSKAEEAFLVEIQLEKMDSAAIEVDQKLGIKLAAKEGATPVRIHAGGARSESRFRIFVGDRSLAEDLASNLARVTAICNLYDCPDGKLCKERVEGAKAEALEAPRRAPTPDLTPEEMARARTRDPEVATELLVELRSMPEDPEDIKATLRILHTLDQAGLDAVRESHRLPRPHLMPPQQRIFHSALVGARFGDLLPVRAYLKAGGDIERQATRDETRGLEGATLLISAVLGNQLEIVRLLLERGADPNGSGGWGIWNLRPVDLAADDERVPILKLLLRQGASTRRSEKGETPLWNAVARDEPKAIKVLLQHGADPSELGTYDEPPLYRAALNGHVQAARLLLAANAAVDGTSKDGSTPLMAAVIDGSIPTMELLLAHGVKIDHEDHRGQNALELARELRKHEVANWLTAHGAITKVERLRQAWTAARPASIPTPMLPASPRPCREGAPIKTHAGVWDDPEYQDFVRRLRSRIPQLESDEASQSTADLLASAASALEELLPFLLGLFQDRPRASEEDTGVVLFGTVGPRMLALAGHLLTHQEHVAGMTGDQFFDAMTDLQLGLVGRYGEGFRSLAHTEQREVYDLLRTTNDMMGALVPCESLSRENQMLAGLLPSFLAVLPAPLGLVRAPKEAGDREIEQLRKHLDPWLERRTVANADFSILEGGLPGHVPPARSADLSASIGDKLPWLVLFYRPEVWRGKPFRCTSWEEALVKELVEGDGGCTPEQVEVGLLLRLLTDASKSGEPLDGKRSYETQLLSLFLLAHYGNILERVRPGFGPELTEWASGFIQSIDLINSPSDTLSPLEALMQEAALERIRNPARAWVLYREMRGILSY